MKVFLPAFLAALTACAASAQVVFVDMQNLVKRHPRTAGDTAKLEETVKRYEAEIKAEKDVLDKMQAEFDEAVKAAQNPALNAAAKKKAEDAAIAKRKDLLERDRQASARVEFLRGELAKQEEGYIEETTSEIRRAIASVAKAKGYKAVLPKQFAIYADPGSDITEEIAKEMLLPPLADDAK